MYPRGQAIQDEMSNEIIAYSARIGLELGADMLKLKYNGDLEHLKWINKCAGRAKIVISGGSKQDPHTFIKEAYEIIHVAGSDGFAIGRNVWQDERPFSISKALEQVVFHGKHPDDVAHILK